MKRISFFGWAVLLLFVSLSGSAQSVTTDDPARKMPERLQVLEKTIDSITEEITWEEFNYNQLLFRHFLEYCRQREVTPAVYGLKTYYIQSAHTKVDSVARLRQLFEQADDACKAILDKHPVYSSLQQRIYIGIPKEDRENLQAQLNFIRQQLLQQDEVFRQADEQRRESLLRSNLSVLGHVIAVFNERQECIPTDMIPEKVRRELDETLYLRISKWKLSRLNAALQQKISEYYSLRYQN